MLRILSLPLLDPPGVPSAAAARRYVPAHVCLRACMPAGRRGDRFRSRRRLRPTTRSTRTRLGLRLAALAAALDDLPGQAKRFATRCAKRRRGNGEMRPPPAVQTQLDRSGTASARKAVSRGLRDPGLRSEPVTSARLTKSWLTPMRLPCTRWRTRTRHDARPLEGSSQHAEAIEGPDGNEAWHDEALDLTAVTDTKAEPATAGRPRPAQSPAGERREAAAVSWKDTRRRRMKRSYSPYPTIPLISRKSWIAQSAYSRPLPDCL